MGYDSLKGMLPEDYSDTSSKEAAVADEDMLAAALQDELIEGSKENLGSRSAAEKQTVDFNGVQVTRPQYSRLMDLQNKVVELSGVIDTITALGGGPDSPSLRGITKFRRLVRLRDRLRAF